MKFIPFYNTERFYKKNENKIKQIFENVFSSGKYLESKEVATFEEKIANFCDRKYAVALASCTDALRIGIEALEVCEFTKFIVPSFSFVTSVEIVYHNKGIPIFIDINPDTLLMNIENIDFSEYNNSYLIATHLAGNMLCPNFLHNIQKKYYITVIEDAAQALGCSKKHIPAGKIGLFSCISFDPSKVIHAFATGGVFLTDDYYLYKKVRQLSVHGRENKDYIVAGYNSRMSSLSAALLSWQLDIFNTMISERKRVAELYFQNLSLIKNIKLPIFSEVSNYHRFIIKCEKRDELRKYLLDFGIETGIHYPKTLYQYTVAEKDKTKCPNSEEVTQKVLSLPIYPELSDYEVKYICEKIEKFYKK